MVYIIIPAYNMSQYIGGCLESILNQSYTNITVVIVDDASTDNTADIIDIYAAKDNRIISLKSKINKGVASARNSALDYVKNQNSDNFICFIDADDYIHPDYLQILINKQLESNADIVWCQPNNTFIKDAENVFDNIDIEISKDKKISGKELLLKEEYRISYSLVWGKLFKDKLWENVRFPENLKYYEDGATTFKAIYNADLVVMSDLKLYYYFYSPNSLTRSNSSLEKCDCGIATSLEKIDFYTKKKEEKLLQMAYVGYANTLLKNIRESDVISNKDYKIKMQKTYKDIYMKAVKAENIGIGQKSKFILYRFLPNIQKYYIKLKLKLIAKSETYEDL